MIRATGQFNKEEMTVEYNNGKFWFNGQEDEWLEDYIRDLMKERFHIAGGVTPEENSLANLVNVLQVYFFDMPVLAECNEYIEPMPYQEGLVY